MTLLSSFISGKRENEINTNIEDLRNAATLRDEFVPQKIKISFLAIYLYKAHSTLLKLLYVITVNRDE